MKGHGQPFRRGACFKDGKLYLFTNNSVVVAKGWPELRAWRKTRCRLQWKPVRPVISAGCQKVYEDRTERRTRFAYETIRAYGQIILERALDTGMDPAAGELEEEQEEEVQVATDAEPYQKESVAGRQFFASFPPDVCRLLAPFCRRQWHLAVLLARCPGAMDLAVSNPALAWCLASNWAFHKPAVRQPLRAARSLIRQRQRRIAEWLGFMANEAVVRVLRKVQPGTCHMAALLSLRAALHRPEALAIACHLPELSNTAIRVLVDRRMLPVVSHNLILEMANASTAPAFVSKHVTILQDALEMWALLDLPEPMPRLETVASLQSRHDFLVKKLNRKEWFERMVVRFPEPPIPGTDSIVPLTTLQMLAEEGRMQGNCVLSYTARVAKGRCFIYRMLAPQRATMSVEKRGSVWRLSELALARNQPVSTAAMCAAKAWVEGDGWNAYWQPF